MKISTVFFITQQDYSRKLIPLESEISSDYENYINEYFLAIKNVNDDKYDMLTHRNLKFLFYNFDNYLNRIGKPLQLVRHTKIADDDIALKNLQVKD